MPKKVLKMKIIKYIKLLIKYNSLELEKERLENIIKDELYKGFMEDITLSEQVESLKQENEKYRNKIKDLKKVGMKDDNRIN